MSKPKPWDLWEVILEETDSKWVRWEDYARLKAEVERLTKAGDAMAKTIGENGVSYRGSFLDVSDSINRWYAAKEGKGQP